MYKVRTNPLDKFPVAGQYTTRDTVLTEQVDVDQRGGQKNSTVKSYK
jgi:hypothetical protein